MCNNDRLRILITKATKRLFRATAQGCLDRIKETYPHTVEMLDELEGQLNLSTCFGYALGIASDADYLELAARNKKTVALVDSDFVSGLKGDGTLTEVSVNQLKNGNLVLYSSKGKLKHAGIIVSRGPIRVRSKWGGRDVHAHGLWEVPIGYGHEIEFVRAPDPQVVIAKLRAVGAQSE